MRRHCSAWNTDESYAVAVTPRAAARGWVPNVPGTCPARAQGATKASARRCERGADTGTRGRCRERLVRSHAETRRTRRMWKMQLHAEPRSTALYVIPAKAGIYLGTASDRSRLSPG